MGRTVTENSESFLAEQPDHGEGHIRKVEDLAVGMTVRKLYPNGMEEHWEIVRGPMLYSALVDSMSISLLDNEWCVVAKVKRQYTQIIREEVRFLADAGVVPYTGKRLSWSKAYLVRVDPSEVA